MDQETATLVRDLLAYNRMFREAKTPEQAKAIQADIDRLCAECERRT